MKRKLTLPIRTMSLRTTIREETLRKPNLKPLHLDTHQSLATIVA